MNSRSALTAFVFAALLSACASDDLTKDQAKAMLNDSFQKNPTTQPLLTGMDNIGTASEAEYFKTPGGKYQKALEADGLITIAAKGKIVNPANHSQWFNALDIALTDKGRKFVTGKPNIVPAPSANTWPTVYENAVFCGKEVADITAVNTNDDSANTDYSWKAANLTPFANDFHQTDPTEKSTCNTSLAVTANASFERKDSVWKLTVAQ